MVVYGKKCNFRRAAGQGKAIIYLDVETGAAPLVARMSAHFTNMRSVGWALCFTASSPPVQSRQW
jgi:hypothetical protein